MIYQVRCYLILYRDERPSVLAPHEDKLIYNQERLFYIMIEVYERRDL